MTRWWPRSEKFAVRCPNLTPRIGRRSLRGFFGLYNFNLGGYTNETHEMAHWVKTAAWVMNRLDSWTSGKLDPRLAEFKQRLVGSLS